MATLILIAVTAILFILAFATKRRFGVLGLGLAAGAVLAGSWSVLLGDFLASNHLFVTGITETNLAAVLLIIAPALVLLLGGPTYKKPLAGLLGAAGFALLGLLLTLGSIQDSIVATGTLKQVLIFANQYQPGLVAVGVTIAVIDMFMARGSGFKRSYDRH